MFEKQLTDVLNARLGEFLEGVDPEDVRVGVLNGDVIVRRVRVRASALTKLLDEPSVRVRYGFVNELRLRIPWRKLGKEEVKVSFDGVYVLGEIDVSGERAYTEEAAREREERLGKKALQATRRAAEAAEAAWLKSHPMEKAESLEDDNRKGINWDIRKRQSGIAALIDVAIANVVVEVSNVHVRVEATYGDKCVPCGIGFTLERMSLLTVGEDFRTVFQVAGFADRLRKAVKLEHIGLYADFDSPSVASGLPRGWNGMNDAFFVNQMSAAFGGSQFGPNSAALTVPKSYVFGPMHGTALYTRRGYEESNETALHDIRANISSIQLSVRSTQLKVFYGIFSKLRVSRVRYAYAHIRPHVGISGNSREWWLFALQGVQMYINKLHKRRGLDFKSSVETMVHANKVRQRYVPLYAHYLKGAPPPPECYASDSKQRNKHWPPRLKIGQYPDIDELEKHVPLQCIVTFRTLAHLEYRKSGGIAAAVLKERKRRLGRNAVVKTVVGLGKGGVKNTGMVLKAVTRPILGITCAVRKSDSKDLVVQQKKVRTITPETKENKWQDEFARTMSLSERSVALENNALTSAVEVSSLVDIANLIVIAVDDELSEMGTSIGVPVEREIFRIGIRQITLGQLSGPSKTEQRGSIRNLVVLSPEGTLMEMKSNVDSRSARDTDSSRTSLWDDTKCESNAVYVQMVKGDVETQEDLSLKLRVVNSRTIFMREPLDRVRQVAVRHQVTSSYILGSFIYQDVAMDRSYAGSIERQTNVAKIKPKIRLDARIGNPVLILAGEGVNILVDLGKTSIESMSPSSAGVDRSIANQHNAFSVHSSGVRIGFIDDDWKAMSSVDDNSESILLPLLTVPVSVTTILQSLNQELDSPNLALSSSVQSFDIDFSPMRVFKIRALKKSLSTPTSQINISTAELPARSVSETDVTLLQIRENGELAWVPAKISLRREYILDVKVADGLRSRVISFDIRESQGASKLRRDLCFDLSMHDYILTVGGALNSMEDVTRSLTSDDVVTLAFDITNGLAYEKINAYDRWYSVINGLARENIAVLVDSGKQAKVKKIQIRVNVGIEKLAVRLSCPLIAHPSEEEKKNSVASENDERALVSLCMTRLSCDVGLASTSKEIQIGAESFALRDDYSSDGLGRECLAVTSGFGSKKKALSVAVDILHGKDPNYCGLNKLVDVHLDEPVDLSVRRSTLLALIALRFRFRPPGFVPVRIMPEIAPRVMVAGELMKKINREIRLTVSSATATALYDHTRGEDIPVSVLSIGDAYWSTVIAPPTRETVVSVGCMKLATGKMASEKKWNVQPSSESSATLLVKNTVYDRGETADGADESLEFELGSLNIVATSELREVGTFFAFITAARPDHVVKWVHPCNRPREGFKNLKVRMSVKVDAPRIVMPLHAQAGATDDQVVFVLGDIEICRSFSSRKFDDCLTTFWQTTSLSVHGFEMAVVASDNQSSKITRNPIALRVCSQKRIDSGRAITNEVDEKNDMQVKSICLDISGRDFRSIHDALKTFKDARIRRNVQVKNPIDWGKVEPLKLKSQSDTLSLTSMQASVSLSGAQVSVYKYPMQQRPISTIKIIGVTLSALKNINGQSGMEMDVMVKMVGIDDDSPMAKEYQVQHIMYAGAPNAPLLRLILREDDNRRELNASLQHIEFILRPSVILDTVQTFAPRKFGGVFLASSILPKDVNCVNGRTLTLKEDLILSRSTRLLADDPHKSGGRYKLYGGGQVINFMDANGELIRCHSHGSRRKTMARIIIGHNATLYFENVVFKCTRSSLSRFIKLGPGARYELGPDVLFDESEEHDRQKDSDAERIEDQSSDRFSLDKARDNTGDRIKRKNKPILIEANVTCVHLVVGGDNARSNQINILFGLTSHIERDERLNMNIICELLRLRTKDTMTPPLLRPMGLTLQLESSGGISKCRGSLTPVELELSPHRIHILKRLCETLASSFAMALLIECGVYSCIWNGSTTSEKQHLRDLLMQTQDSSNTAFTIWRPVVPSGYGMLADVVKSERGAPENTVWLVRDSSAICALPERFERVEGSAQPCFWRPIAPKGFISLGLIATASENEEPSLDTVRCIRQELVTNIGKTSTRVDFTLLGDSTVSKLTLWKTNNAADGFVCTDKREWATSGRPVAYDIRSPTGFQVRVPVTSRRRDEHKQNKIDVLQSASCATVVDFKRIGIASSKNSTIGFWAPVPPTGYVSTGHCISKGDNPPLHTRVFAEDRDLFQPPDSFEQLIPPRKYGGSQRLCIWKPVPPHGFVSVGVIVTTEDEHPEFDTIACVRADLVSRITHGQLTKYNSFWVDDEHAASPTHFWITNSHTQNFISSELEDGSEVAPDIGFDVGYMRESSTASEQPTLMLKFDAPLIQVGMAFERVLHNQLFYLCKLEGIRTTCTRESKNLTLSTDASLSLMHKNRRNGHLEPIISPWHFSFLLDDAKNDIKTVSAASRTMKIQSKDECAFIISQAAIVDVLDVMRLLKLPNEEISKIALGTSYKAVQNNVIINSTGRSLWVQTPAGDVDEIPHGQDIAQSFKNEEVEARARRNLLQSKSSIRTRGRTDVIDEVDRVGDERLSIAHLIVDVLEIENEDVLKCLVHPRLTLKLWDEQLKKFRTEPLPLNTFTGSVKMRIPHPLHRMEKDSDYVHHYDIKVVAEVSYFGSNGEKLTVSGSVNIPAENLRGNQSEDDTGLWIRCDDGGDKAVQVRIRAHAVEGLTLSPIAEVAETASILRSPRAKKRTAHNTPALVVCRTNDLVKIWWTRGKQKSIKTLSAWHPRAPSHTELELRHPFFSERTEEDYKLVPFGTILVSGHNAPRSALMAVVLEYDSDQTPPTAYPIDFENIWTSDNKDVSFWKPIAPAGYAAIGNIVTKSIEKPSTECVVCVREALTDIATTPPGVEWKSSRGFRKIARGDFILIQNGDVGAGGWTFIKEELSRTNEGVIMATVPPLRKLNQNLCIPCLEDESALEIWFDTITLVERFRSELQAGESVLVVSFSPTGPFETLHLRLGTSHVVQHSTHDLVFDGTDGRLLSRTFVENETQSDLIARVRRLQHGLHVGTSSKLLDKSLEELDEVCLELFEAERYYPFKGWSTPKDAVVFNSRYTTRRNGRASHRFWPHLHPPKGYKFSGPWRLDTAGGLVDASGWAYGATWVTKWPPPPGSNKRKARSTRRRRWVRDIMKVKTIESFSHRTSIHTMRQDQMEEWSGDLAVNDKIILPPVSRNDHYGLLLRRVGEQEDLYKDDNPLQVGRLSEREGRAFKYSNGKDYFILLVQERDKAREGTFGHIPGIQLRIIAPVHIVSAVNCKSRITIFADGENVFADDVNVLEIRRVTSIDSSKKLEFHMVMFAEHHAFGHDRSVLLNVSPAGSPPNLQILWLDVKGYRHLTSPVLLDAKRTKLSGNEITDDDDAEQLLTVDYSNMLLITNASSLEIKTLTWFGVTSTILDKNEDYVNNPPGTTLPAMFLKSHVQQQGSTNAQEFVLGLCVDSTPVRVMVSARSKPVIMTVPTASGNKIALSVSVNIWRETSTFWPTLEVIVQPMLVAVNLTRVPLAIRASGMGYTTLTPSSHPTPFSLDIASAKDIDGVEAKLNDTSIQIADISSGEENLSWSSPLVNLVHYSGAFWAIPRSVEPSVDDIAHFRILPYADEDGDPVNFARPLIIQFSVERSEQGCFRIFFKGGDGASLKTAPIMVNNHLPKPLMLRQVKNHSLLEGNASLKRMSTRQLSKTLIPNDVGMGQSFALHAYASMSWGWSVPGVPMKFNKRQNSAQGESMVAFKRRKFLQLSMSADSSCIVEIDTSQSNFHGFIHLGELEYEPRGEQREIATILGEWRGETFSIFIVHKTIMFDNFSFTKEFMKQTKEVSALMKRKEQHLSVSLDACSLTIVDRVRHSFVELIRISIDHIKLARGSALFAGRSTYNHLIVGALQIDFSAPGAMYPVFVWHDPSIGNFLEVVATMSKGDTDYNIVHRFNLMSPREGIIVRGGEELIWAFWDFFTSLKAQLLLSDASNSQGAPGVVTSRPRKQRDEKLQIVSLCIDALTFVVTFHPDSNIRPKDADARVISLLALSSLQGLRLTLEKFQRSEENTVRSNLVNEFVKYIKLQMVAQTLSIMTSMQTLTNVSTGLDAAAKAVETGFGVLETKKMQKLPSSLVGTRVKTRKKLRNNVAGGVYIGLKRLSQGVFNGVIGLVVLPFKGAREGGIVGCGKGCGKGIANLVVKPVAGAISLAAKTVEGVANTARDVQAAAWELVHQEKVSQVKIRRLPIAVRSDGVIRPYNERDAFGVYIMRMSTVASGTGFLSRAPGLHDHFVSMHEIAGNLILVLTNNRAMAVSAPEMDGHLPKAKSVCEWYISWTDVSSIWIKDTTCVKLQLNVSNERGRDGSYVSRSSFSESLEEETMRFVIRALDAQVAFEIEASARRCWQLVIKDDQFNNE